jgi:phage N-6-adenine-methyltransferase
MYLCNLLATKSHHVGTPVDYVFMDTGAEHPETYQFIKNAINIWELPISLIRVVYNEVHGKASTYRSISQDELKPDLGPWIGMLNKYGTPYIGGARCTDRMKQAAYLKYCQKKHGKKGYVTWLGIRFDEPARLWGDVLYKSLAEEGYEKSAISQIFVDGIDAMRSSSPTCFTFLRNDYGFTEELANKLHDHLAKKVADHLYYLAELSDYSKQDVIAWWKGQQFDLGIDEHLGNCVFCIKKSLGKLALAARDEPELYRDFLSALTSEEVKIEENRIGRHLQMYRKKNTLPGVIGMFSMYDRDELANSLRSMKQYESGSCSESCDIYSSEPERAEEAAECEEILETTAISEYCSKLAELRERPSHLLKEVGDQWRTPDTLFWGINAMFGPLVLDLFTDGDNSKCPAFYTAEDNALTQDWSARLVELHGAAFGNPPYSRAQQHEGQYITGMQHIMAHTMEMRERGGRYVFLIKAATSETWWPEQADHVAFIRGRVGFDVPQWFIPADEKQVPTGAFFAGAVVIFDKTWRGPAMSYVSRTQLESMGEAFLAQIRREAERLLPQIQPQNIPENIPGREVAA